MKFGQMRFASSDALRSRIELFNLETFNSVGFLDWLNGEIKLDIPSFHNLTWTSIGWWAVIHSNVIERRLKYENFVTKGDFWREWTMTEGDRSRTNKIWIELKWKEFNRDRCWKLKKFREWRGATLKQSSKSFNLRIMIFQRWTFFR